MASITDHVIKLQELTQKNLEILQALNDSFFTNQNHLSVKIGNSQYAIPSFISLENKLNSLTANFENLVNAPSTGEAFFDFNGNSRAIQVRSYTSVPQSLVLDPVANFEIYKNDIFKDFLTPSPYINLKVTSLPNDTTEVVVKKVIPLHSELKQLFKSYLVDTDGDKQIYKTSIRYNYKDLYKVLDLYKEDEDYIEYDTRIDLPIRKNVGSGIYVIEEIIEDIVDENLDNYITIKFRTDVDDSTVMSSLKYRLFDETIERMLKVGDQLVTYEGNAKMEITEIRTATNTIVAKVLHGEFLNLVSSNTNNMLYISPLSKIKFYSPIDFDEDKYVKVPLEEDQYVFVAVAALNSRMNVQAPWGTGILLNTYMLKNGDIDFKKYYDENVRNVGDVLYEMTALMSTNTLMKYSKEEYEDFTGYVPTINTDNLNVVRINDHLNNSTTVQNIRSLYSQKTELQTRIDEKQNELNDIKSVLQTLSFDDTTGQRSTYISQINSLNAEKNDLMSAFTKTINEIATSANNSEVPIENAKYRVRGFFDTSSIKWDDHIKGIRVQYRYKNAEVSQNHAMSIGDKFVFSDWNEMESSDRERIPYYQNGTYKSTISPKTDNINEPSFNQIDIPISQGESIDIRLKLIYDFGAPFVTTSSKWSPIVNIKFPEEFLKDIKILDIISENNNDIETNRFNNIIKDEGIPEHINDMISDQNITYFHKPENIASGFYTEERRIIPLKDKLSELNNLIQQLKDEVYDTKNTKLKISIKQNNVQYDLNPGELNIINLKDYSTYNEEDTSYAGYKMNESNKILSSVLYISILNDSEHSSRLYSMFPGNPNTILSNVGRSRFDKYNYGCDIEVFTAPGYTGVIGARGTKLKVINYKNGIWMEHNREITTNKPYVAKMNPKYGSGNYLSCVTNWPYEPGLEIGTKKVNVQGSSTELLEWESEKFYNENNKISIQTYNQFIYFNKFSSLSGLEIYGDSKFIHAQGSDSAEPSFMGSILGDDHGGDDDKLNKGWYIGTFGNEVLEGDVNPPYWGSDPTYDNALLNIAFTKTKADPWMDMKYPSETTKPSNTCMYVYPSLTSNDGLRIPAGSGFLNIGPKEEILIPIVVEYFTTSNDIISKTISFDLMTSQYEDPVNYTVRLVAKYESTVKEQLITAINTTSDSKYNIIYK